MSDPEGYGTDHIERPEPTPTPRPETTHYQTLVNHHGENGNVLIRIGGPTTDADAAVNQGIREMEKHNVKECFVVTVHAAFSKEVNIKKVI